MLTAPCCPEMFAPPNRHLLSAQDQFILQMISLMDRLLKRENLDLRLTPYKVRTGVKHEKCMSCRFVGWTLKHAIFQC